MENCPAPWKFRIRPEFSKPDPGATGAGPSPAAQEPARQKSIYCADSQPKVVAKGLMTRYNPLIRMR